MNVCLGWTFYISGWSLGCVYVSSCWTFYVNGWSLGRPVFVFFVFFSTVVTDSCSHKPLLYLPFLFVPLYVGRDV